MSDFTESDFAAMGGEMNAEWKSCDKDVRVMQVIVTTIKQRGDGKPENPIRVIKQIWSMDGDLLAESDPLQGFGL